MSLADDQIKKEWSRICSFAAAGVDKQISFARAIEAPLLKRIAELEQRNRDLYEDMQRFRQHALNEKDARMALERELEAVRKDAERMDWIAIHGSFGVDSVTGQIGGNGQKRIAATRTAIDAAKEKQ